MHTEINGRIPVTMAKSTGSAITELANAFYNYKPDMVVVHGDRYEALAAATAASLMNIYVVHVQGGEVSGTIDEHIRHAITKLSHLHLSSTKAARERIIKMGEQQNNVHMVGCPASEVLLNAPDMSFEELSKRIAPFVKKEGWKERFNQDFFLVVYHPVTTEFETIEEESTEVLEALKRFDNSLIVMWPNIDAGGEKLVHVLKEFERENDERIGMFPNFPIDLYANVLRHAKVMIGNSSSGIREACYFGTPVVDVGSRQYGREQGKNVVNVPHDRKVIEKAIRAQLKKERYEPEYIYGKGGVGKKMADIIATVDITNIQKQITF